MIYLKTGIIALKFPADKCHALKNIGKQTNWFASYYIKIKRNKNTLAVDKQGCSGNDINLNKLSQLFLLTFGGKIDSISYRPS